MIEQPRREVHVTLVRASGLAALSSMGVFALALSIIVVGAHNQGLDLARIDPPLGPDSLVAFHALRSYYWPVVWLAITSLLLLSIVPLGLSEALGPSRGLTRAAAILYYFGLVFGVVHVGFQSLAQTWAAAGFADSAGGVRAQYLRLGVEFYAVNDFFEKGWGIARSASMLLFAVAFFRSDTFARWVRWIGVVGSLEIGYRIPTIATNRPSDGLQDLFFNVWLIGVGVALLRFKPRERTAKS